MKALDLIEATGQIDDRIILEVTSTMKKSVTHTSKSYKKRIITFALAAALILSVGLVAYAINARIVFKDDPIVVDGEEYTSIGFEAMDNYPVYLGVWELTNVPDGFSPVKSYYRAGEGEARTDFQNADGDIIMLIYQKAHGVGGYFDKPILHQEDVTVNGNEGQLYVVDNGWSYVFWTDAERGIGFRLSVKGEDYDLLSLAESVQETGNYPSMDNDTRQALEELGDWNPALPEGFAELMSNGVPGDYAYLWRTYANAGHYEIQLNYEKPMSDLEGYVSHYRNTSAGYGVISYTPVVVNGCDGWLMENEDGTPFRITWLDEDNGLVFQMTTNGVDSETLLTAAQGVIRK